MRQIQNKGLLLKSVIWMAEDSFYQESLKKDIEDST